jgi:hypothetical protein
VTRYVWPLPCTTVGLLATLAAMALGAKTKWVEGVLEVALAQPSSVKYKRLRALPFVAITLGHVVIGLTAQDLEQLRAHEQAHVRQYERWGPLFFVAYPASSAWQWLRGKRLHSRRGKNSDTPACTTLTAFS